MAVRCMRKKLYDIIFGNETKAGRIFDQVLLLLIVASVIAVIGESIPSLGNQYGRFFYTIELLFTVIFSIEYLLRIYVSPKPLRYIFSFWGIIDLIAVIPTILMLFFPGVHFLLTIRSVRLLRIFRIFKLVRFMSEAQVLMESIRKSFFKIGTFFFTIFVTVIVMGTIMYVVEGPENGFTSIPQGIYWAIITLTTVGYGDLVPTTALGKFISSFVMIIGYAIIAVPTGIFTVEIARTMRKVKTCDSCRSENEQDAKFCDQCGEKLK